jgi:uncharacterized protein YuzE
MTEPKIKYDEPSDTVQLTFIPGRSATGIELNENLLLRWDPGSGEVIGLDFFNFSVLAQKTEWGVPSYPLYLDALTPEVRDKVVEVLQREPLKRYLRVSALIIPNCEPKPITSLDPDAFMFNAA